MPGHHFHWARRDCVRIRLQSIDDSRGSLPCFSPSLSILSSAARSFAEVTTTEAGLRHDREYVLYLQARNPDSTPSGSWQLRTSDEEARGQKAGELRSWRKMDQ